ncbi:ABC transporter permease [Nocardioides sp. LHG3406-4]|uniref:ABC transporter permease n=1 Tax=Nocardioides sp. LHG3406-4 TaxID=2804575 RepID=UPI003CF90902
MTGRPLGRRLVVALCLAVVVLLYVPLVPPFLKSIEVSDGEGTWLHYRELAQDLVISDAVQRSVQLAVIVGVATALLALVAGLAIRRSRIPRVLIVALLMPLFVPAVSAGLSSAMFFKYVGLEPSLLSMVLVQVCYCLPFAFLIVITSMSTFEERLIEAAYMSGATPVRAFWTVELPIIRSGVVGGAVFSMVLSLNETIRTSLVQGPFNTIQTYIWATYLDVGINPSLYALMSIMILATAGIIGIFLVVVSLRSRRVDVPPDALATPAEPAPGIPVGSGRPA